MFRISGDAPEGELGFRFGEPLDVSGDGHADIAAGARLKLSTEGTPIGSATVWSGGSGTKIREWDGTLNHGLFGHWVMPVPDLDGDKLADIFVAAPQANVNAVMRGVLSALSPKTGAVIWQRLAEREELLGWDMALAGDQNGDGAVDLFAGSPAEEGGGRVYLLSGKDGAVLRTYQAPVFRASFGWYVSNIADVDGDGRADFLVGDMQSDVPPGDPTSIVFLISAASGAVLREWSNTDKTRAFGEVVASMGDLDGDGRQEVVIASPRAGDSKDDQAGEVQVFSATSGKMLHHWFGKQPRERYGRMVMSAGDIDGDGIDDLAIGAPLHRVGEQEKTGRVELRSGRTAAVLAEWFGDGAESWFGWHIRRAPDPEGKGRPALLVGSLRQPVDGQKGVGVIDLYVFDRPASSP